jgi:lycopene cyclase domain-containing protein
VTYTQLGLLAVAATVVLDLWILRTRLVTRRAFWLSYAILVFFQLLTNGLLTGLRIVRYDGAVIVGDAQPVFLGAGRIAYAPIEDLLFGFALVLQAMAWWVFWGRRGVQRTPTAGPPRWWGSGGVLGRPAREEGTPPGATSDDQAT